MTQYLINNCHKKTCQYDDKIATNIKQDCLRHIRLASVARYINIEEI